MMLTTAPSIEGLRRSLIWAFLLLLCATFISCGTTGSTERSVPVVGDHPFYGVAELAVFRRRGRGVL